MNKPSKEVISATNKVIQTTFNEIKKNDLDIDADRIFKEKFEENYIFENFFRELLQHESNLEDAKNKIIEEVVDTLFYNDGDVTIEEIVEIIYLDRKENKPKRKKEKKAVPLVNNETLCIQIKDSFIEINESTTEEEKLKLMSEYQEKEPDVLKIKESPDYNIHKQKKNSFFKEFFRIVIPTAFITFLFINFVGQLAVVCGNSMNDNFHDGDIVFMEKITQRFGNLERFDVIIFDSGLVQNPEFVKRIIALPGEQIRIDEKGNIYINGERLYENYGKEVMTYPGIAETTVTLAENEYFVLGDNRNNSEDSRFSYVGVVNLSKIKGKICLSLIPFSTIE